MNDIETTFVNTFISRDKRERWVSRLASDSGRSKLLNRLAHVFVDDLDPRFVFDKDAVPPFSHWRAKFTRPVPAERRPETLPRNDAETLLRRYLTEEETPADGSPRERACYLLALMLERKRRLRPTDARTEPGAGGRRLLFYEHRETGETFVVVDPGLRLDQLEALQREVADLLRPPPPPTDDPGPGTPPG